MKLKVFLNILLFIYIVFAISLYGSPNLTIYPNILGIILTITLIMGSFTKKIRFELPLPINFLFFFIILCLLGTFFVSQDFFFFFTLFQVFILLIVSYNILLNSYSHVLFYWAFTIGCLLIIFLQVINGRNLLAFRFIVENRLGGTAGNVNDYGYFLSVAVTYLFFSWNSMVNNKKHFLLKISIFLIIFLFSIEIIFFTLSKSALILLLFAFLNFILSIFKNNSMVKNILIGLTILFSLMILNPKNLNFELSIFDRFSSMANTLSNKSNTNDGSTTQRLELIYEGFRLWSERPFLGWGPNQFRKVNKVYNDYYSHNNYVEVLSNFGLTGFILFYFTHFYLLIKLIKLKMMKYVSYEINWLLLMIFMLLITDFTFVSYYNKIYYLNLAFILFKTIHIEKHFKLKRVVLNKIK